MFPVSGPPLARGTITIIGDRIATVEPHGSRTADEDLGNVAIIPGLVNAHTHLDLSGARGKIPPTDPGHFTDWLGAVIAYRRNRTPEQIQADIRSGLAECLRHGTTLIGDIASDGASWAEVALAPVRAVIFREVIGITEQGVERWKEAVDWVQQHAGELCQAAYSPHAPYSVNAAVFMKSVGCLRPVAIHLAESPAEIELLEHKTGPFVEFLRRLGLWENAKLAPSLAWILESTQSAGSPRPVLYVHGNYLPANTSIRSHVSIAYCPRTHAAFQHPPHPFRELLARKVRVCLGTDSLASNPDLDILAEARFLHARHPDLPGDQLLRMVTLAGAEALGWQKECGSLEPQKSADLVAVPLPDRETHDPHELLFANDTRERRTMFRGEWRGEPLSHAKR